MIEGRLLGPYYTLSPILNTGLGNQLFVYAVTRTIAEMRGFNYCFNKDAWQGYELFDVSLGIRDGNIKNVFVDNYEQNFNPEIFNIEDFTLLDGYFQSEKYFDHNKVRQWFKPKIKARSPFSNDDYCFIHYRGGDYSVPPWDEIQLPISYYHNAKQAMLRINSSLKFVVITNSRDDAINKFPDDEIISGKVEDDFVLLNSAKYLIISNSSFPWWAAWLNTDNIVVGPRGWYNYNKNREIFSPADIKVERFIWI